jgi:alpha-tubulin suppressor-like RCC1 family protein
MYGWGTGVYGAIGHGSRQDVKFPREIKVKPQGRALPVRSISCGRYHSMCISGDFRAFSWGSNTHGKLGHGHTDDVLVPTVIEELSSQAIDVISAGEGHSAAINRMKKLYTWGNNTYGRLGIGADSREFQYRAKPTLVRELDDQKTPVVSVCCGSYHTFAVTCEGRGSVQRLWAFGENQYGKLGLENGAENDAKNRYTTHVSP